MRGRCRSNARIACCRSASRAYRCFSASITRPWLSSYSELHPLGPHSQGRVTPVFLEEMHNAAHNVFITLAPYTGGREDEVQPNGSRKER